MFLNVYKNKTVLVTGHTGFKGSWLSLWLASLGTHVIGVSAYLPSDPCNFSVCRLENQLAHHEGDVQNYDALQRVFDSFRPDMVFHLAAQPIVRRSYEEPKLTFDTNVGGTVNVLECIRKTRSVKAAVIITSDKCYRNVEWTWGYRENDVLGGDDPYSASKAGAEIAFRSYVESFFKGKKNGPRLATVRAGNVIGGGDWAEDRIVPDCVRAWANGKTVLVRSPEATRPWQLVLEPLSGYLWLGAQLYRSSRLHGESFNFGPDPKINKSVNDLLHVFGTFWKGARWKVKNHGGGSKKESTLLKLSCDKALHLLGWLPVLSFEETVRFTAKWYRTYYEKNINMYDYSQSQIREYVSIAKKKGYVWVKE